MPNELKKYALYDGDEFVAIGTASELAAIAEVSVNMIRYMMTPAYQRKLAKRKDPSKSKVVVRLDIDIDDADDA